MPVSVIRGVVLSVMGRILLAALVAVAGCSPASNEPKPMVVDTTPKNGDLKVDPGLDRVSITFDSTMLDESWSWVHATELPFPKASGEPFFDAARRTANLPVILQPKTRYEIRINSEAFQNFQSENGVPAEPYVLQFETGE